MKKGGKGKKIIIMLIITGILSVAIGLMSHSFWVQQYGEENYNIKPKTVKQGSMPVKQSVKEDDTTVLGNFFGAFTQDFSNFKITTSRGDFNFGVFFPSFLIVFITAWIVIFLVWADKQTKEAQRVGHEHGKAHIGKAKDYKEFYEKFTDPKGDNVLFSQNVALSMDNKKTNRVSNTLIIGGTGTGKTFRYIKPNIAQFNCSRVITDPSGDILREEIQSKGSMIYEPFCSDSRKAGRVRPGRHAGHQPLQPQVRNGLFFLRGHGAGHPAGSLFLP